MHGFCSKGGIVVIGLMMATASMAAERPFVTMKRNAVVAGQYYSLADIAKIGAADALSKELGALRIGIVPPLGYSHALKRREVSDFVEQRYPALRGILKWAGSEQTRIRGGGVRYDAMKFIDQARTHLLADLEKRGHRYLSLAVAPLGGPKDVFLPSGAVTVKLRTSSPRLMRRMCVWVDIVVDGEHYQSIPVWFRVEAHALALVAKRSLDARYVINESDFEVQRRDIANLSGEPLEITDALQSLWLRRAIPEGSILLQEHLKSVPEVKRHQYVDVWLSLNKVQIRARGIAQRDARLGELVAIQSPSSLDIYTARVIDDGRVEIVD